MISFLVTPMAFLRLHFRSDWIYDLFIWQSLFIVCLSLPKRIILLSISTWTLLEVAELSDPSSKTSVTVGGGVYTIFLSLLHHTIAGVAGKTFQGWGSKTAVS